MIGLCQNELPFLGGSNNISEFYGLQQNCPWPLTLFIPQFMSKLYGPKLHYEKYFLKISCFVKTILKPHYYTWLNIKGISSCYIKSVP